jgi:polysaccharide pyruvyl transferase WcaK-like protein
MKKEVIPTQFSCFLLGYTGCHNTGSDVRILTIIDDLRDCFGDDVSITVASFHPENTAKVIPPSDQVTIARVPFIFPLKTLQLVIRHDVTMLVEGSCFKENWAKALLYLFLWGALWAKLAGKKCIAYAIDVGELSPLNRFLTRTICNKIDLLITRTEVARKRLIEMGVKTEIIANTDTAFRFLPEGSTTNTEVPSSNTLGIAPVEFHQWPLKTKLYGKKEECYNYPYYYTWDDERREKSRRLIEAYCELIRHAIEVHDLDVVLIAMEALDSDICRKIFDGISPVHRARVRIVASNDHTPYRMAPLLRGLKYLVTARYHACVISLNQAVPQMAIAHDERLVSIYSELGIEQDFLLDHRDPGLTDKMIPTFDLLVARGGTLSGVLKRKHDEYFLPTCARNKIGLKLWAQGRAEPVAELATPMG